MKKNGCPIALSCLGLTLLLVGRLGAQPVSCRVVNLMPQFWKVASATSSRPPGEQVERFRAELVQPSGDLYAATGFGFASDVELDAAIPAAIADAHSHSVAMRSMTDEIVSRLPAVVAEFQSTFPDFRCDFPVYLAPSLSKLDGAGRIVNQQPALVIGIDQVAQEYSPSTLPIFLAHELFHRYHRQVAGFSDDEGDRAPIWRALWAEGLATYASMKLNPDASLQDALILPKDLVSKAQPQLRQLVADILPYLDQRNHSVFAEFFEYHRETIPIPSRAGYYLGALAAQRLNEDFSLFELAHMKSSTVKRLLRQALGEL